MYVAREGVLHPKKDRLSYFAAVLLAVSIILAVSLITAWQSSVAATDTLVPNADITNAWPSCSSSCPAMMVYSLLDEGSTVDTSDWISTNLTGSGGEVAEFGLTTVSSLQSASQVQLCINAQSATNANGGALDTVSINLRINGTLQAATTVTPAYNSWGAHCATFNGSWTQSDVDGMQAHITRNVLGGGKASDQDDEVRVAAVYADITYTPADIIVPNEDVANAWTTCNTTCPASIYTLIDDGASPNTSDWISASTSGSGGEVAEFGLTTLANVDTVSQIELCIYAQSNTNANGGALDTVSINLRINGSLQTATTVTPAYNSWSAHCATFSGSWTQPQLDAAQAHITRNRMGGGSPSSQVDNVRVSAIYANITYTAADAPILEQSSYRLYNNADSASPGTPLAAQDTSATIPVTTPFRVRQLLAQTQGTTYSGASYKLQLGEKITTCSAATYADVSNTGGSTTTTSTGFVEGATNISNDMSGGSTAWSSPQNAQADDGSNTEATVSSQGEKATTHYLKATDFGFAIPSDAVINGVEARYERGRANLGTFNAQTVSLVKGGVINSDDLTTVSETWASETKTYGSSTNLWGTTLTPAEVNSPDFGVAIMAYMMDDTMDLGLAKVTVDYVSLNIHYTLPASKVFYYDNASVADDVAPGPNIYDPVPAIGTVQPQTYNENGLFTNTSNLTSGTNGLWDFSLTADASADGKTYCFRVVESDNTPLSSYVYYPEVTFGADSEPTGSTLDKQMRGGQAVIDGVKQPFSW